MSNDEKKVSKFTKKRMIFLIICIVVIAIAVILRLTYKEEEAMASVPVVDTMTSGKGDIYSEVSVTGTVLPIDTLAVVCKVTSGAEVKEIYVKNGDYVNEGDPICELDNQKQIDAAFITYDAAKNAYERVKVLYERGDISKQSFEQTKAQYDGAKLSYDTQVEFATPVATGDGYIENTNMTVGVGVDYKDILCYITSDKGKEIQFGVTERAIGGIKVGDNVVVEKAGKKYNGIINDKASLISSTTGLFNIKATIIDHNDLAQGIMAKVTTIYDESLDTMIIPREVVYYENEKPLVYYLDKESKVRVASLTLGIETDEEVEVLSGIDMNTKIISTWNSDLVDGTLVKEVDTSKYQPIKKEGRKRQDRKKDIKNIDKKDVATYSDVRDEKRDFDRKERKDRIASASSFGAPYGKRRDREFRASFSEIPREMKEVVEHTEETKVVETTTIEATTAETTTAETTTVETTVIETTSPESTVAIREEVIEPETSSVSVR